MFCLLTFVLVEYENLCPLAGILNNMDQVLASFSGYTSYPEEWKALWHTVETICQSTMDSGHLWMDMTKGAGKRRALTDLLKLLEHSGLQKHKFGIMKVIGQPLGI